MNLPEGWEEVVLEDVSSKITDGSHQSPKSEEGGLPMLSVKDMDSFGFDIKNSKTISIKDYEKLSAQGCKPEVNDILIAKDGSVLKHIFRVKEPLNGVLLSSIAIIRPIERLINPSFLVYILLNPYFKKYILNNFLSGSGVPRIVLKDFKKINLTIPPLEEQKAIANILSSFDEKIELLKAQNETLEEMAQGVFREWFVKFNYPNASGKMVDGEMGDIPEGWRVKKLEEICNIKNGFAFKSKDYQENGIKVIRTTNFNNGSIQPDNIVYLSEEKSKEYYSYFLDRFDFLVVMVGASIGKNVIVPSKVLPALQNQNMWNFKSIDEKTKFYNIFLLKKLIKEQANSASGSARDFFRKDYFYSLSIVIPDNEVLSKFSKYILPFLEKIDNNISQIQTLQKTRDTVLPKLMSGELRVEGFGA